MENQQLRVGAGADHMVSVHWHGKLSPFITRSNIPRGLVARIPRFHRGGPGSIPGVGTLFTFFSLHTANLNWLTQLGICDC